MKINQAFPSKYIKAGDLACIGVFQKHRDELRQDAEVVRAIFEAADGPGDRPNAT